MLRQLFNDEGGAIISAELVLVLTILVIGVIVGLSEVAVAVNTELNDVSNAIGSLDQSFFFTGFHADYHRPSDDWEKIDVQGTRRVAALAFELAAQIAERAQRPEFVPPRQ